MALPVPVNSNVSGTLVQPQFGIRLKSPGARALTYKEQSHNKGKNMQQISTKFHLPNRRDMSLLRDGTDSLKGSVTPVWLRLELKREAQTNICTSIQGIPKKVTKVDTSLWTRNITTLWQLSPSPPKSLQCPLVLCADLLKVG